MAVVLVDLEGVEREDAAGFRLFDLGPGRPPAPGPAALRKKFEERQ